ncbi:LysR family transcriptional regulator [Aliiglaciecola sp. 2_MG-2023]|uniref:LysR family transcriptional regulator n=1 Tax=unclassified Aliiglaciecola TaxID=2593648 RepID=UPI0026E260C9|nr:MULTISPECIES: LysR family transcriptional regulator [unclassified Aliiglaciecola]MDO6711546.1 LysR family transcriptional regulator [Aliiglaciecola sp. 2_MG-2023]MDO6752478.1 LysR family transcriptional regulator [Aliiglaciecola sp. 1_MG-2023]
MNTKQLEYFLITVQKGSIAAAARELDIAQPAISQQLANLEREMGAALLERSFRGVTLTQAGQIFVNHAQTITKTINDAKIELQQLISNRSGTVRVGMLPSIGNVLSMPLIAEINRFHPHIKLEISTGPSYAVKEWLKTNQLDIALTYEQEIDQNFMTTFPLIEEYMYLVVGSNDSAANYQQLLNRDTVNFWELSQFELLTPGLKDALGQLINTYELTTGVALKHNKAYSGQLMTGLRQVIQGEGLMILPSSAMYHLEESKVVKTLKIEQPEMTRLVLATTNKGMRISDASIQMLNVIKAVTASEQSLAHWRGRLAMASATPVNSLSTLSAAAI